MTTTSSSSGRHRSQVTPRSHDEPILRVVRGEPTAEELAALTVVVAAMSRVRTGRRPTPVGAWASYADAHRRPPLPGPGGWRTSGRFA